MFRKFFSIIKRVLPTVQLQQDRDDAYLAESVDIYDLERRMRELDQRGRYSSEALPLNFGFR